MFAAALIDKWVAQFDDTRATALDILNMVHKRAVADSLWRVSTVSLGSTVAATGDYDLPANVVNLRAVKVTGSDGTVTIYDPATLGEIWNYDAGAGTLDGAVFAESSSSSSVLQFALRPAPSESSLAITGLQALEPADLTDTSNAAGTPIIPDDFHMPLLYSGMVGYGYSWTEERDDLAAPHLATMENEIERLKARKVGRVGGGGLSRMRVSGYDFA